MSFEAQGRAVIWSTLEATVTCVGGTASDLLPGGPWRHPSSDLVTEWMTGISHQIRGSDPSWPGAWSTYPTTVAELGVPTGYSTVCILCSCPEPRIAFRPGCEFCPAAWKFCLLRLPQLVTPFTCKLYSNDFCLWLPLVTPVPHQTCSSSTPTEHCYHLHYRPHHFAFRLFVSLSVTSI